MKDNEEHLSLVKGTKKRLAAVGKKNNRGMRGQLDHMLDEAEKQAIVKEKKDGTL